MTEHKGIEMFMRQYQHLYDKLESWDDYGFFEIIAKLKDGRVYYYDCRERYARKIRLLDNVMELTEEEWRRGFVFFLNKAIYESSMMKCDVAEQIGVSSTMLSRYLTGKATPSSYVLQKLANVLDCTVIDILPHDFIPISN